MSHFCSCDRCLNWQDLERLRRTHVTKVRKDSLFERVLERIDVSVSEKIEEGQFSPVPVQLDSDSLDFLFDREGHQDLPRLSLTVFTVVISYAPQTRTGWTVSRLDGRF